MLPYIMLFLVSLILTFISYKLPKDRKNGGIFLAFIVFLMFFIIQAIRYDVGTDFLGTYTKEYYNVLYGHISNKLDIGFVFLYKLIIFLNLNKQWIFVLSALIFNVFIFRSIFKRSKNPAISLFVFFLGTFFFFSMNGIRQSIAISIFYYSLQCVSDRNLKKYLLLNFVGILFHSSTILLLPLYFILTHKFTRNQRIITMVLLIVSMGFIGPKIIELISMTKYRGYLINEAYNVEGTISLSSIVNIIVYILFEINDRKNIDDKEYNIYLNMHFFGVIVTILSTAIVIIFRLFLSFRFVEFLSIPYLVYYVNKINVKKKNKIILYCAIIAIFVGYFIYCIVIKNYNDTVPYKTIFNFLYN